MNGTLNETLSSTASSLDMRTLSPSIPTTELIFGTISMLCFLIGTPSSFLCLMFFSGKRRKTINIIMFILISVTDMVTCGLMLFVGLSTFRVHFLFNNPIFCNCWGYVWSVVIKLSIVMIAVLSVTRTVSILYPLCHISISLTLGLVGLYLLLFLVHSTVPFWFGHTYTYFVDSARCTWDDIDVFGWGAGKTAEYVITPIITYLVPTLTVLVCFVLLISKLLQRTHQQVQASSAGNPRNKSLGMGIPRPSLVSITSTLSLRGDAKIQSTITVLILTLFYMTLTLPSTVIRVVAFTHELVQQEPYRLTVSYSLYRLLSTYFLPINSVCNTIVYFVRLRDLRFYTLRLFQNVRCKLAARAHGNTTRVFANNVAMTTGSNDTSQSNKAGSNVTLSLSRNTSDGVATSCRNTSEGVVTFCRNTSEGVATRNTSPATTTVVITTVT